MSSGLVYLGVPIEVCGQFWTIQYLEKLFRFLLLAEATHEISLARFFTPVELTNH